MRKEKITLVGSSLGGILCDLACGETRRPGSVDQSRRSDPHVGLRAYLGPQQAFSRGERYELTERAPSPMEGTLREQSSPRALTSSSSKPETKCSITGQR